MAHQDVLAIAILAAACAPLLYMGLGAVWLRVKARETRLHHRLRAWDR